MTEEKLPINHGKPYTKKEIDTILDMLESLTFKEIGKKLGRKPECIADKLHAMGTGVKAATGLISAYQLSLILGLDIKVVTGWINKYNMPASKKYITERSQRRTYYDRRRPVYLIDINQFWNWARKNQNLLDLRKMDTAEYIPDWASKLRFIQLRDLPARDRKPWTTGEIIRLKWEMDKEKPDFEKLALECQRSIEAVISKKEKIQVKQKTPEEKIKESFQVENVKEFLKELYYRENLSSKEIAERLGMPDSTVYVLLKRYGLMLSTAQKRARRKPTGFIKIGKQRLLVTGKKESKGYVYLKIKDHPYSSKEGLVVEQRVVMEKQLGRYLHPWEKVKRLNEDRSDNRPENLYIHEMKKKKQEHYQDIAN